MLEVSKRVLMMWKVLGRLDIRWQSHFMREMSGVQLCFNCAGYRHRSAQCSEKQPLCRRCGDAGHMAKDCTQAESCRNCRLAGKNDAHGVQSTLCPLYRRALDNHRLRQCQE